MSMNWSDLLSQAEEGGGFDALPAGEYLVVVKEATGTKASTGKDMVKVTFEITEGAFKGRFIWNNFVVTKDNPNALKWFFRHMAAFGLGPDFFKLNPSMQAVGAQLVGKTVVVTVKADREYQGVLQNDVTGVRSAGIPGHVAPAAPTPAVSEEAPAAAAPASDGAAPPVPF